MIWLREVAIGRLRGGIIRSRNLSRSRSAYKLSLSRGEDIHGDEACGTTISLQSGKYQGGFEEFIYEN